jgi:hypothetical protein
VAATRSEHPEDARVGIGDAHPSGPNILGQLAVALNRTIRNGQTEIAARWFDRDPWVWAL